MRMFRAAAGFLMSVLVIAGVAAEPAVLTFEKDATGSLPAGFSAAMTGRGQPAKWAVVEDAGAIGGKALAQTSADRTDYRFPMAIYDATSKDVEVSVHFRAVSGRVDQAAGIAVRIVDADNYYVVRANALENNVNFYRVIRGNRMELAGDNARITPNTWHTLTLRAEGDRFTISLNGKQLFATSDKQFANPGKVGLWTKADSVTYFDKVTITPLP